MPDNCACCKANFIGHRSMFPCPVLTFRSDKNLGSRTLKKKSLIYVPGPYNVAESLLYKF